MMFASDIETINYIKVPTLVSYYQAGLGNYFQDGMDYEDIPDDCVKGITEPYVIRVSGDSMEPELRQDDKLIIDTNVQAKHNNVVAVYYNGSFLVKRLHINNFSTYLYSDNQKYKPIKLIENDDIKILGVAVNIYRRLK